MLISANLAHALSIRYSFADGVDQFWRVNSGAPRRHYSPLFRRAALIYASADWMDSSMPRPSLRQSATMRAQMSCSARVRGFSAIGTKSCAIALGIFSMCFTCRGVARGYLKLRGAGVEPVLPSGIEPRASLDVGTIPIPSRLRSGNQFPLHISRLVFGKAGPASHA